MGILMFLCFFFHTQNFAFSQQENVFDLQTVVFERIEEPNEKAFSLLIPKGWKSSGGIFRIDPTAGGGSGNAIDAKVDFTAHSTDNSRIMIRFLPDMNYFDMRYSPAGQMGMFPSGSNYNGMLVSPYLKAGDFIQNIVIPYVHPELADYRLESSHYSPDLVELTRKEDRFIGIPFEYDAGVVNISYMKNGKQIREVYIAVTQDFGQFGAGLWKNRHTMLVSAPEESFEGWAPVFHEIIQSVEINWNWLVGEIRGQVQRGEINAEVLQRLQQMDRDIQQSRAQINTQINHDMFLNLTGQEEFTNPYTNRIETGSNAWDYRWVNQDNEVIYTDNINYNPNTDQLINRDDFKLTPVHKK